MVIMSALGQTPAPTQVPTFFPTASVGWKDTHHAYFPATWYPTVAPFHDPSGNWLFFVETWKSDGGMLNCSSFSDQYCTTKIHHDTPFYTDDTLSTVKTSGVENFDDWRWATTFIVEKANGDEVIAAFLNDGEVFHCSWYGDYRIIDGEGRETCYSLYDFTTTVRASTQDSFGKILTIVGSDLKRCDASGETDINVACTTVTDLSSISNVGGLALSSDETEIFVSGEDGIYRGVVDSISTSAISITWDLVNLWVTDDYLDGLIGDNADDTFQTRTPDSVSMIQYYNESLYIISRGWTANLAQCTGANECAKIPYVSKYGGGQFRFRDDDGGSGLAGSQGLFIVDDCFVAVNYAADEMWCPGGLPANTMPASTAVVADDEASSAPLIATSTLTGVLGLGLMGACFYIYTLRVERAAYEKVLNVAPDADAGHHEMTTA